MISNWRTSLKFASKALMDGRSLDVVGVRRSGRTTFLNDLTNHLSNEGWRTLWIRGNASLASIQFGALQTAGLTIETSKSGKPALTVVFDALLSSTGTGEFAFIVDNWSDLDESSWGVLEAVRERTGCPIALSRLQGPVSRQTPSGLHTSTSASAFVVQIEPMSFEDMKQMVESRVGGSVDPSVLTRVYAQSGGLAGIAIAIIDAGILNNRLVQQKGVWHAPQSLWTQAISGVIEEYLESLNSSERDAVMLIASARNCDMETIREMVDWSVLESLESRTLLKTYLSGGRQLVTLYPPVLVEHLQNQNLNLHRARITEVLLNKRGTQPTEIRAGTALAERTSLDEEAAFTRLVHDQIWTKLHAARIEWESYPSAALAIEYVLALLASNSTEGEVARVFATPFPESSDFIAEAKYLALQAEWIALGSGDLDAALTLLNQAPEHWGPARRITDAWSVMLSCTLGDVPEDYETRLEMTAGLPTSVEIVLMQAQIYVYIALGRFRAAIGTFGRLEMVSPGETGCIADALYSFALLGMGEADRAQNRAQQGLEEARKNLDMEGVRTYAAVLVYFFEMNGQYDKAHEILNVVFNGGTPPKRLIAFAAHTILEVTAALVAARRGNEDEVKSHLKSMRERGLPAGPLPQQSVAIVQAQILASNGDQSAASEILWAHGSSLRDRGLLYAGVMAQLAAIEVLPNRERLHAVAPAVAMIGGDFVSSLFNYLEFVTGDSALDLRGLTRGLIAAGRSGHARAAVDLAARRDHEQGDKSHTIHLRELREEISESYPLENYNSARFNPLHFKLTERETEVVFMIADGLKNPQIAELLVLSVRTVETHIRRILRKTGTRDRQEIIGYVASRP